MAEWRERSDPPAPWGETVMRFWRQRARDAREPAERQQRILALVEDME